MTTILIHLSEVYLKKIDYLIKIGRYLNRSDAIKSMIDEKLTQEVLLFEFDTQKDIENREKIMKEIREKNLSLNFINDSNKTAADLINEERER